MHTPMLTVPCRAAHLCIALFSQPSPAHLYFHSLFYVAARCISLLASLFRIHHETG